jgi:hypothetical protein
MIPLSLPLEQQYATILLIMMNSTDQKEDILPWKYYAATLAEVAIAFSLATFSLMLFMTHLDSSLATKILAVSLVGLYIFVIFFCIKRLIERLSAGALMLMVPIVPLAVLLLVVCLLPIIQKLL